MNGHNGTARIITLFGDHHRQHAPHIEFLHGQTVPYFEIGRRVENIFAHLSTADLILPRHIEDPIDISLLYDAHDAGMIAYLQQISANVKETIREEFAIYHMEDQIEEDNYFYESVFPPKPTPNHYIYDSVCPIGKGTWKAVLHAATLAVRGADVLIDGGQQAYAVCRPPGHHAGRRFMGGYCYINNAAVAAYRLKSMGKVAILDIDYHHGNGTQDIFWDDPDVLFVSIHADPTQDYPRYAGFAHETGGSRALGTNINLPLPHGTDVETYFETLHDALHQIQTFQPATLVVSLGFDTYKNEPMGHFRLDIPHFETMGSCIAALGYPTLYVQEGGYAIDALGALGVSFFSGVLERR